MPIGIGIGLAKGGGVTWSPLMLSGLGPTVHPTLSRSKGQLWQDTGKTVPATAHGHPVKVATCPYTGRDFSTAVDADRPTLYDEGDGFWSLAFAGVGAGLGCTANDLGQPVGKNLATCWYGFANGQPQLPWARTGGGNPQWSMTTNLSGSTVGRCTVNLGTGFPTAVNLESPYVVGTLSCFILRYDGTTVSLSQNRGASVTAASNLDFWFPTSVEQIGLGTTASGHNPLSGRIRFATVAGGGMTDAQKSKLLNYLKIP